MFVRAALVLITAQIAAAATEEIAVVGAGISGLVAAVRLQELGHNVTVFERAPVILSIVQSLELEGHFYDYLSVRASCWLCTPLTVAAEVDTKRCQSCAICYIQVALCPIPTRAGETTALGQLAQHYGHTYEPLPATLTSLSFDTAAGITQVPTPLQPYVSSPAGLSELLDQLAKGNQLLEQLDQYVATPQGAVDAGIASANETFAEWAAAASLPAFTQLSALLVDSAVSGPANTIAAPTELLMNKNYSPGLLRSAFLSAGKHTYCAIQPHHISLHPILYHMTCMDMIRLGFYLLFTTSAIHFLLPHAIPRACPGWISKPLVL